MAMVDARPSGIAVETPQTGKITSRWFLAWFAWGAVGAITVWSVDGVLPFAVMWLLVGIAIGRWGGSVAERLFSAGFEQTLTSECGEFTYIPVELRWDLVWINRTLDILLDASPIKSWTDLLRLAAIVGAVLGLFVGPLVGLCLIFDADLHFSAVQGALWGTLLGPPFVAPTAFAALWPCWRYDKKSRPSLDHVRAIARSACEEATHGRHGHTGPADLLLAIMRDETSPAARMLANMGVTLESLRTSVKAQIAPANTSSAGYESSLTEDTLLLNSMIIRSHMAAKNRKHRTVTSEHLLFALLECEIGVVPRVLKDLGLDPAALKIELRKMLDEMGK